MPFMLDHTGKYRTKDKLKIQTIHKLKTIQEYSKQNYSSSVASYDTELGNKVGLFYNTPEPTRSAMIRRFIQCLHPMTGTVI